MQDTTITLHMAARTEERARRVQDDQQGTKYERYDVTYPACRVDVTISYSQLMDLATKAQKAKGRRARSGPAEARAYKLR